MRIVRRGAEWVPRFTVAWEVSYLQERPDRWVPFYSLGNSDPLGEIHSTSHEIRIREGFTLRERQVVSLGNN